jgi:endonuclease I
MGIRNRVRAWLLLTFTITVPLFCHAQQLPPATYYTNTVNLADAALKAALHNDIKGHTVLSYSPGTREALFRIDTDPAAANTNIFLIYSEFSDGTNRWINNVNPAGYWNREHLWPQSFGVNNNDGMSDLFNLRPCDMTVNGDRGNKYYDNATTSNTVVNAPGCYNDANAWEPRDDEKGQIARSAFYMAVRYEGIGGEDNVPNLELSDTPNAGAFVFGKLTTMLAWNRKYPVTDRERNRNSQIALSYQFKRNPFIDNPDFADRVFTNFDGFTAWQGTHFTPAELSNASISGDTADPDSDGVQNLAEYALGHDPHVAEPGTIQSVTSQIVGGTNYIYLVHHKHHYVSGITFTYQTSIDLLSWSNVVVEVVSSAQIDAVKDSVTVRLPANDDRRFVRFKISRP